ncbi:hypothetical protein EST38_g9103 [Candolleomyces aberdarensis]|uniref:Uncharacterized protein n=1 Tax=Candolleomyces aberdarensis TaxID=2316362 RepID=A0A4Q2DBK4_9AGAR|nr:hypothetical protein EST38_g9103 [Candolleomyces aberdarensis]
MELCKAVLDTVCRAVDGDPATIKARFKDFLTLVPAVRSMVLEGDAAEVATEPFRSFFRKMISAYLVHVLGTKENFPPLPRLTIGCGKLLECSNCPTLDAFLNDLSTTELTFNKRIDHIQDRIRAAGGKVSDRITFEIVRTSGPRKSKTIYTSLLVKKCPEVLAEYTWKGRQGRARAFLEGVWDDEELEKIMGERYEDVLKAVGGEKPFVGLDEAGGNSVSIASASAPGESGGQNPSSGFETSAGPEFAQDPPIVVGVKRKERDESRERR